MDAPFTSGRDDVPAAASEPDRKLLECCPLRKRQFSTGVNKTLLRVLTEGHAGLPHLPKSLRTEPGQVDETSQRQQSLVRRDVRSRLLAADVLLAGGERQDEAAPAVRVGRLADDAAGHAADVVRTAGAGGVGRPACGP